MSLYFPQRIEECMYNIQEFSSGIFGKFMKTINIHSISLPCNFNYLKFLRSQNLKFLLPHYTSFSGIYFNKVLYVFTGLKDNNLF